MLRLNGIVYAVIIGVFFLHCIPDLLYETSIPSFKAPTDKALVVVYRLDNPFGVDDDIGKLFIDNKFAAANEKETIVSFTVEPGRHFLFCQIDATGTTRLEFKAGRVYYMQHVVFPIVPYGMVRVAGTTLLLKSPEEYESDIKDDDVQMRYARFNPEEEWEDMEKEDYQDELKDYEEWLRENPKDAKKALEYPGY